MKSPDQRVCDVVDNYFTPEDCRDLKLNMLPFIRDLSEAIRQAEAEAIERCIELCEKYPVMPGKMMAEKLRALKSNGGEG